MTEVKMKFCQSCGERIPLEVQICPKCNQWTVPLPGTAPTDQQVSASWVQKMGREGLLALSGYILMAVSAFLPWATISTVFGQIQMTGLQVAKGEPGIILLAVALIGGLATLWPKKTYWTGFGDLAIGIIVLLETVGDMSNIRTIAESATTSLVRADLGSGSYLAIAASFLVMVAGVTTVIKVRSARQTVGARQLRKRKQEEQYDFETEVEQTEPARKATGLKLLAFGAYKLDGPTIDSRVTKTSPGAYAVGVQGGGGFYVQLVGRSDTDLKAQLGQHIGKYDLFKFEYFDSPEAAFRKECELYHTFNEPKGRLANGHPERLTGTTWQCPKCSEFNLQGAARTRQNPQPELQPTVGPRNQFCVNCGSGMSLGLKFCPSCGAQQSSQDQAPLPEYSSLIVSEQEVWIPILWLIGIIVLSVIPSIGLFLGVITLVCATIYVHYNSKKHGVKGDRAILTLIIAIVGLPLYARDLHKLRQEQASARAQS